jgi:hypothetical protein
MEPIFKSTIQTFAVFLLVVAMAYFNRDKIERFNHSMAQNHPVEQHK